MKTICITAIGITTLTLCAKTGTDTFGLCGVALMFIVGVIGCRQ